MGERDIMKIIQLLPGVQGGQEGTTGFYVRGGNLDQNLVQLDEATVYNPNHLFGLFSTFNVNAINNVQLIKGGFPAEYGGRLSSILNITMKEGNKKKYEVEGGIGLLSNNLTIQGPIQKNKSSFIVSARRSHIDLLLKATGTAQKNTSYKFYDVNAKMNFELGKKDHLFLSFFKGNDNAAYNNANSLNYTQILATVPAPSDGIIYLAIKYFPTLLLFTMIITLPYPLHRIIFIHCFILPLKTLLQKRISLLLPIQNIK